MQLTQLYDPSHTICAIATPHGSGAIAIIRLSGPDAFGIMSKIWKGKSLNDAPSHTAHLGYIVDPDTQQTLDQALATIFRAPNSYTGDDTIEISVHGSRWIQQQLIDLLCRQGARPALPGEYTQRAFAAGKLDLTEAEAVADLIAASSKASHKLAISQLRGSFSNHLSQLREKLITLSSLLELELDFSEEDVEFASRTQLCQLADNLYQELNNLYQTYNSGQAIKNGITIAITGPTNAGKSSLLNTILGDQRAIVSDIHGTTRDIVEDTIEIGPYLYRFQDTAGLRQTNDTIEQIGIQRSHDAAKNAQITIYLIDPTQPLDIDTLKQHTQNIDPQKLIIAINKNDIVDTSSLADSLKTCFGETLIITISAISNSSVELLLQTITEKTQELLQVPDTDITLTNARQAQAIQQAADAASQTLQALQSNTPPDLIAQHLRQTIHHLSEITGEITSPDILNTIFQNFCIGK